MERVSETSAGLGDVYREHSGFVRACLRRFQIREEQLDDAVQEVFVAMLGRAGDSFDRARHVRPWLLGISRNVARNERRRVARRARLDRRRGDTAATQSPEEQIARQEATDLLRDFLRQLDPDKLTPFVAMDIEGRPAGQVALELGLPVTTVRWRVRAARAELEAQAARRSPNRFAAMVVWLWPFHSARIAPKLVWLVVVGLLATSLWWWPGQSADASGLEASSPSAAVAATGAPASGSDGGPTLDLPPSAALSTLDLKGASISGRVVDPARQPIAGARVCHHMDVTLRATIADTEPVCETTDATGHYRLTRVRAGGHRLRASAPGFLPGGFANRDGLGLVSINAGAAHPHHDIVLQPGGTKITGTVVDGTGGTVAGAVVRAKDFTRFSEQWSAIDVADDDGAFELWVVPGPIAVTAMAAGYAAGQSTALAPQDRVQVELMPEVVVEGRVVDAQGAPLPNMRVRANRDEHNADEKFIATTTDHQGRFVLERLRPGAYRPIAVGSRAYGEAKAPVLLAIGQPSPVVTIVAQPAATLDVEIVGPSHLDSCDGAFLMVMGANVRHDVRIAGSLVEVPGLVEGPYELMAQCQGMEARARIDVPAGAQQVAATLTFEATTTARGRLAARGSIGPATSIIVVPAGSKFKGSMLPAGFVMTRTRADGSFGVSLSEAGAYDVVASPSGGAHLRLTTFTIEQGEHRDLGELQVPPVGEIIGRVVDSEGAPMPGLLVVSQGRPSPAGRVRPDGTFAFYNVEPGTYRLYARQRFLPLGEPTEVVVSADDRAEVQLSVPRMNGAVGGVVEGPDGDPAIDAMVGIHRVDAELSPGFDRVMQARTDDDGLFDASGLLPGDYRLTVTSEALPNEEGKPCTGEATTSIASDGTAARVRIICG